MRVRFPFPLALLAALVGCTAPERTAGDARPPAPLPDASVLAAEVNSEDGALLRLRARRDDGSTVEVAELVGAWIDLGDGGRWLAPGTWTADGDTLSAGCDGPPDHQVRISVRRLRDGDFAVSVEDRIGVRVDLAGLGVAWRLLAAGPPDEVSIPLLHPDPDGLAADAVFRAPVGFLRCGSRALAVLPDLDALATARRLPEALTADSQAPGGAILLHAAVAQRVEVEPHRARATRDPHGAVRIRDEVVRVGHRLHLSAEPAPGRTLARLLSEVWQDRMAATLQRSASPFVQESWESTTAGVLEDRIARDLRPSRRTGLDVAFLVDPDARADGWETARFGARRNSLVDAVALARTAIRTGDPRRRETAAQLVRFVLLAPRHGGLVPQTYRVRLADETELWSPGDPDGPRPKAFCAADSATTAILLIELAELLPEFRDDVRTRVAELARFLLSGQRGDGAIPGVYEPPYLRPVVLSEDALPGATAGPALFLARYAAWTDDAVARDAARRAVQFVARRVIDADAPIADPSIRHVVLRDPHSGDTVRDLVPLSAATLAALTLAAEEIAFAPIADSLLGALAGLQQVWTPPWLGAARLCGGFGGSNDDATWNAPGQDLAVQAMLDGYAVLRRREWLERGAAGLRAALLEPAPILPSAAGGEADRLPFLMAAAAVAERCRARFGQALVDLDSGFAIGLDSVWFEDLELAPARIAFQLRTTALSTDPIDVRLATRGLLPPDLEFGIEAFARPADDRLLVRPARDPVLWFSPPPQLDGRLAWRPLARYAGPAPQPGSVYVELLQREQVFATLELSDEGDGLLESVEDSFTPTGVPIGERIGARLVLQEGSRRVLVPPTGAREITIGSRSCIDPGDDLETTLKDASPQATIVRFVDGRENARRVTPGQGFAHALPVPRDAAAVEIRILAEGRLEVVHEEDRRTLYVDGDSVANGDRVVTFRIADPRLWPEGELTLRFLPVDEVATVARIEFAASGIAARTESAGAVRVLAEPDPRIELLVQTIRSGSGPAPSEELLRQALVGDEDYRTTPEPSARSTAGSLATWIARLSGGRSQVIATFRPPIAVPDGTAWDDVLARLGGLDGRATRPDAVVLVHAGPPVGLADALSVDGIPVIVLPEREPDGSFLSCGRIARALLSRLYHLEDLDRPENGNFGTLGLTAQGDAHEPVPPIGVNLIRTGWADIVDLVPDRGAIRLPPLLEGRTMLRMAPAGIPGAPDLLVETRRESETAEQGTRAGLLVYRRFHRGEEPIVRLLDGRETRPRTWRLSPTTPTLFTPFRPGNLDDLFTDTPRLDDLAPPSLVTPRGETPWRIDRIGFLDDTTADLRIRWTGTDLLATAPRGWLAGRGSAVGPITEGRDSEELGSVTRNDNTFDLRLPASGDATIRAVFLDPGARAARRLFGKIANVRGGDLRIEIRHGGSLLSGMDASGGPIAFAVDLLPAAEGTELVVAFTRQGGAPRARFETLLTVPRSAAAVGMALPEHEARTVQAVDGGYYSSVWTLRMDQHGRAQLRMPVLPPATRGVLRLVATTPLGDHRTVTLRIALRPADGGEPVLIHDGLEFPATEQGRIPLLVALCELPASEERRLTFLELEARGEPGAELHLLTLETDRL